MGHANRREDCIARLDKVRFTGHTDDSGPAEDVPAMFDVVRMFLALVAGCHFIDEQGEVLGPRDLFINQNGKGPPPPGTGSLPFTPSDSFTT